MPMRTEPGNFPVFSGVFDIERFYSSEAAVLAVVLLVLLIMFLIALSATSPKKGEMLQRSVPLFSKPKAHNLFLKVGLSLDNGENLSAYLRALALKEASFVVAHSFTKGQSVKVNLDSLPGFPLDNSFAQGHVTSCRSLGGNPEKYLLRLRFKPLSEDTRRPLLDYLVRLSDHPSVSYQI
jgi:hypothetical protein